MLSYSTFSFVMQHTIAHYSKVFKKKTCNALKARFTLFFFCLDPSSRTSSSRHLLQNRRRRSKRGPSHPSFFITFLLSLRCLWRSSGGKEGRRDEGRIANRMRCCCITRYCTGKLCVFCSAAGNVIVWLLRHHTPPRAPLRRSARKGPLCRGRRSPT